MPYRQLIFMIAMTVFLISVIFISVSQALAPEPLTLVSELNNVRDYAPTRTDWAPSYVVDGGMLLAGAPLAWKAVQTPDNVIVSAVALDDRRAGVIYIGAANQLAIYRSTDSGQSWLRIPLRDQEYAGGVTDIAVDSVQRLVYVGTDTAGLFRLRDVGSSVILTGHVVLGEPVLEVAADSTGAGIALARTAWHLYRAENYGLHWVTVENLASVPTALAIADSWPTTIYVGTTDRGVLKSQDGLIWTMVNAGLGFVPGSRLEVNALSVDPRQPEVLYVATSYLYGSTEVHRSPAGVAMSTDAGASWLMLHVDIHTATVALLPVSGQTGAVYALTTQSRRPLALGHAPAAATVMTPAPTLAPARNATWVVTGWLAWIAAGVAALTLLFVIASDLRERLLKHTTPLARSTTPDNA